MYSRKSEEYAADFILLTRRTLTESQYRLFDLHYLRCLDWRKAAPRLGLDRGEFFREAYRIQQRLGRVYRETVPYGLWPLDEYFHDAIRGREPQAMPGTPAVLAPKVLTAGRSAG
jgi:hypothetical protein